MQAVSLSVFFHNYYGEHSYWANVLGQIDLPFDLYYNVVDESIYNIDCTPGSLMELFTGSTGNLKKLTIRYSSNRGKDIGGKMVLFDAFQRMKKKDTFILFLHDKKSLYTTRGVEWRKKLLRIIDPPVLKQAIHLLNERSSIGIVAAEDFIHDEYDNAAGGFKSTNRSILDSLMKQYDFNITDYRYVAGTMFIARSGPFEDFFSVYPPADIRATLEPSNIMDDEKGTVTHSWERLLSWIVTGKNYKIKGV